MKTSERVPILLPGAFFSKPRDASVNPLEETDYGRCTIESLTRGLVRHDLTVGRNEDQSRGVISFITAQLKQEWPIWTRDGHVMQFCGQRLCEKGKQFNLEKQLQKKPSLVMVDFDHSGFHR